MQKIPKCTNTKNTTESAPKFIFWRENVDKTLKEQKYGHCNQIQVQESVMRGEDINTPYICCTQCKPFNQLCEYEC